MKVLVLTPYSLPTSISINSILQSYTGDFSTYHPGVTHNKVIPDSSCCHSVAHLNRKEIYVSGLPELDYSHCQACDFYLHRQRRGSRERRPSRSRDPRRRRSRERRRYSSTTVALPHSYMSLLIALLSYRSRDRRRSRSRSNKKSRRRSR